VQWTLKIIDFLDVSVYLPSILCSSTSHILILATVRILYLVNVEHNNDVMSNLLLCAVLLQILNKIPYVTAQLLRQDSDSSRSCLQMVVNMCCAMIVAFPRNDSIYDPVMRAMKVPYYRNLFPSPPLSLSLSVSHRHTRAYNSV
jgi:undecaprenyl pyrophosphate phosphatase UppP